MRRATHLTLVIFVAVGLLITTMTFLGITTAVANANQLSNIMPPIVAEDFDYGMIDGDLTSISGGNWAAHSAAGNGPVQYISSSLTMPNYGSSGIGGAATISQSGAEDVHLPFTQQTTGTLYFAALVDVATATSGGDYFLHFSNASTGFRARVFVRDNAGVLEYGLSPSSSTATYAPEAFAYDTTYLVAVKYDIDNGDSTLYVLDAVTATEPITPLVSVAGSGGQTVERVAIRQGGSTSRPAATIDGVRVADNWADLMGEAAPPAVASTNPAADATNVALTSTVAITFSEVVTVTPNWYDFACTTSGVITSTAVPASPAEAYTLIPDAPLAYDEDCTVTVLGDQVTNSANLTMTADYSFTFSTESLIGDITFVYNDLEDVVQAGEIVYIAGDFTNWISSAISLTADATFSTFSVTVPGLTAGDYDYKYIVYTDTLASGSPQWEWLNTNNRTVTVSGDATVQDYRHVVVGWANLQWPPTLTGTMGMPTSDIYGRLYIENVTNIPGMAGRGLQAEVGYGAETNPDAWDWFPMSYFADDGPNNDEFIGVITPTLPGVYSYTTRYDANWGMGNPHADWTYASLNGLPFDISQTGVITVEFAAVPIADARAGSNGEIFALEGTVTAPNSTWNNAPEWVFQDATGGIAAFFIANPPIALGDTVRMVATRGAFNNQEQMTNPIYFDVVSAGTPPDPISYTTGQVAAGDSEGWLVSIEGELSNIPASCGSGYNVTIDDGSGPTTLRIEAATDINICDLGLQNGDMLGVVGFSTQFQSTFQVKPRSLSDLTLFTDAPVVIDTNPDNGATNVPTNTLLTVNFSEPVSVTPNWFDIQCSQSGAVTASSSPAGPSNNYTLTPSVPFVNGDICAVTILADEVSNGDMVNMLNDYTFTFTVGDAPVFGACGDPATGIHFIQGSGDTTPIFGTTVVVEAVVVGSYQQSNQFRGFFLQERDDRVDGNPLTSEGLFIFHETTAVSPGDLVRVRGTATEFSNMTQLGSVTDVTICDTGYTVTPAAMTLPVDDMMDWEAAEGMLLSFTHELYVTEHFNMGRFGEVHLSVNDRLWNPTNIVAPGAPALALQDLNNRSRILLDDGLNVQNPATVIYPDPGLTYTNTLRAGATVPQLTGVLDYRFNSYRIQPVGVVDFVDADVRPEMMDEISGTLKVASFNVLNYFTTLDGNGNICGPSQDMGCRGADSALELERQRIKIINAILAMDADVVGLIEIENNVNDDAVIDLVAGLNELAGEGTYARIETGTIGTDAIKQAFIYQPATVTPVGDFALLDGSVDARFLDDKNRPVLIQTFADNSSGERFTVAVNHLKSKGSACDDVGDPDVGDGQGNCNVTRTNAAEALVDFLATDPTNSGTDRFLIIGDLNAYAMEDPIMVLVNDGYTDLLRESYGDQAYSYVFDGQFGHLDHGLANAGLMPFVTGATAWHINADEPRVLDYNTEFKTAAQIEDWFGPGPFRSSDHDPVIVGLSFPVVPTPTIEIVAPMNGSVYTLTTGTTAVTIPVTISTTNFTIPEDGHWHISVNGGAATPVMTYTTMLMLAEGEHVITAVLHTPDHTPLGISDSVTVTVVAETVEPQPPAPPIVTAPISGTEVFSQPTFVGLAMPGVTIIITDEDGELVCETVSVMGEWECTPAAGLPLGTQTFTIVASNDAGDSDPVLLTLTVVEETVPPVTYSAYLPLVTRP